MIPKEVIEAAALRYAELNVMSDPVARMEAALTAALSSQWRGMESAPRDGTIFDVWLGDASREDVEFYCTPGTRRSGGWSWRDGKFRPLGGLPVSMPVFVAPTHWMPLPPPPTQEERGKDE